MKIIKKIREFFELGEKVLFRDINKLVSLAVDSVKNLSSLVSLELDGNLKELKDHAKRIAELEKEGDLLTLKVTENVVKGALATGLRESFIELLQRIDNILDSAHILARDIVRTREFIPLKKSDKIKRIFSLLFNLSDIAIDAVEKLSEMLKVAQEAGEEAISIGFEIEKLEEMGDDLKEEILDRIYEVAREMHFQDFYHVINITHQLDNIIDGCEDASNSITTIIKSLVY